MLLQWNSFNEDQNGACRPHLSKEVFSSDCRLSQELRDSRVSSQNWISLIGILTTTAFILLVNYEYHIGSKRRQIRLRSQTLTPQDFTVAIDLEEANFEGLLSHDGPATRIQAELLKQVQSALEIHFGIDQFLKSNEENENLSRVLQLFDDGAR